MSKRTYDKNGFLSVNDNPVSKVGVFPYRGSNIGAPDPTKTYMVLRPAEELSNPDTINSIKLLPWVDDHEMVGDPDENPDIPMATVDEKPVHGTTGERVYFDENTGELRANLCLYSKRLKNVIQSDKKKELSLGYRCRWEYSPGEYEGTQYDYVQRDIRGNHLALVDKGRMGSQVAVQDEDDINFFAFDSQEILMSAESASAQDEIDPGMLEKLASQLLPVLMEKMKAETEEKVEVKKEEIVEAEDSTFGGNKGDESKSHRDYEGDEKDFGGNKGDESKSHRDYEGDEKDFGGNKGDESKSRRDYEGDSKMAKDEMLTAMDAKMDAKFRSYDKQAQVNASKKANLVQKLTPVVGVFDHAEMTLADVEQYGCEKIGLDAEAGSRDQVLSAFFKALPAEKILSHSPSAMDGSDDYQSGVVAHYS